MFKMETLHLLLNTSWGALLAHHLSLSAGVAGLGLGIQKRVKGHLGNIVVPLTFTVPTAQSAYATVDQPVHITVTINSDTRHYPTNIPKGYS